MAVKGITFDKFTPTKWTEVQFMAYVSHYGYDCSKVKIVEALPDEVKSQIPESLGIDFGKSIAGGSTNMKTGEIFICREGVPEEYEVGVLVHEIWHGIYSAVLNKLADAIEAEEKSPEQQKLIDRFKPFMLPYDEFIRNGSFVSSYATEYLIEYRQDNIDFQSYVSETLSEMARLNEQTGNLPNTKFWRDFYNTVYSTAKEFKVLS
jgi:hypothetical protein